MSYGDLINFMIFFRIATFSGFCPRGFLSFEILSKGVLSKGDFVIGDSVPNPHHVYVARKLIKLHIFPRNLTLSNVKRCERDIFSRC